MAAWFPRRLSPRVALVPLLSLAVLATISFVNWTDRSLQLKSATTSLPRQAADKLASRQIDAAQTAAADWWTPLYAQAHTRILHEPAAKIPSARCPSVRPSDATIDTAETYSTLNFQPEYMQRRDYWDSTLEKRYHALKNDASRPNLKVVVLPHSHVDPGWLRTFDDYFSHSTRSILDNMVAKLTQHRNMTFIWTEMAFFAKWWQNAHPAKRRQVKQLVDEGRLEFTSASWVMPDEATTHLYSLLDQMIEGHQWLKSQLNVVPKSVWTVDPFGHGPVAPYLLRMAGLQNTVVQRIHYGFKRWLADRQISEFLWKMSWETDDDKSILCHNFPFDIYSTKHSCGPDPKTCLAFDFRSVPGEYTEYSVNAVPITKNNVQSKAEMLLEQYAKSGSLTPHNVVLVLVGDDFRYDHDVEWDQQYINYQNLFNYINSNRAHYNAEIAFGTLSDYFDAVRSRSSKFPRLRGDFFPYSDIFSEGRPAYWTGYFTTRPFYKALAREVETRLRGAEIVYTVAANRARQTAGWSTARRIIDFDYGKLVTARRWLALFQHHDAITGTSKVVVMQDYGEKLFAALTAAIEIESRSSAVLLADDDRSWQQFRLLPAIQRPSYAQKAEKVTLELRNRSHSDGNASTSQTIVLYNSDAHFRHEVVRLKIDWPFIRVTDSSGTQIRHQINPTWAVTSDDEKSRIPRQIRRFQRLEHAADTYELVFIAPLPPLSLTGFRIEKTAWNNSKPGQDSTLVFCSNCNRNAAVKGPFQFQSLENADIQLENKKVKLLFDGQTGFLRSITKKTTNKTTTCSMQFAAYPSTMFHSGAYLFQPDANSNEPYIEVLKEQKPQIFIISGTVMSEISVVYDELVHSTILFHKSGSVLEDVILMESSLDMGPPPVHREREFFIRFKSGVRNVHVRSGGESNATADAAEFYTDQNGFQMTRRVRLNTLGVEANYYPVTSAAYIQDRHQRLNVLVASAHGLTSLNPGWIELMIDRRTIYDDGRGMGEGVTDNFPMLTPFILILEDRHSPGATDDDAVPKLSLLAHQVSSMLLYPAAVFLVDSADQSAAESLSRARAVLLNQPLPCNIHLVGLRTLSESSQTLEADLPSSSALLTLHNRGYDCSVPASIPHCDIPFQADRPFHAAPPPVQWIGLHLKSVEATTLTGLHSRGPVDFDSIRIPPMEISSFNVTFA